MKKQIFTLMLSSAVFFFNPAFAMEESEEANSGTSSMHKQPEQEGTQEGQLHPAKGEPWAGKGDWIFLAGTSSAGKTTASKNLKSKCSDFLVNGRDYIMGQVAEHPYDPASFSMNPDDFDLKVDTYYLNHLAKWILEHQDEPIILDVLTPQPIMDALERLDLSPRPFKVLLYVPLLKYRDRLLTRNETALKERNFEELRNPLDMALQYQEIFKVSSQDTNFPLEMKVSDEAMKGVLNSFSQDTVKLLESIPGDNSEEIENEEERQSEIEKALSTMFSSLTEGYLIPKENYDLIIDTSIVSRTAIAEMIQELFLDWKKRHF